MPPFRALYYPNDACGPLTFKKAILAFDELAFYDHSSIAVGKMGTVGHESIMRSTVEPLKQEGYKITVLKPFSGIVQDELKLLIDEDLGNDDFRRTFIELLHNDPTFIMTKVVDGNYGEYGDAAAYRQRVLQLKDSDIPRSTDELEAYDFGKNGMPPEISIALTMALDSFNLNFSGYASEQREYQMFGDSRGMDMLLKAKFANDTEHEAANKGISQAVAFAMLERMIPNHTLHHKSVMDVVHFRNEMTKERERFKERILQVTADLQDLSGSEKEKRVFEIINGYLVPEYRSYQEASNKNWDKMFNESIHSLMQDADDLAKQVATIIPLSVRLAILTAAASVGKTLMPHVVGYLTKKKELNRTNPYAYLMKLG